MRPARSRGALPVQGALRCARELALLVDVETALTACLSGTVAEGEVTHCGVRLRRAAVEGQPRLSSGWCSVRVSRSSPRPPLVRQGLGTFGCSAAVKGPTRVRDPMTKARLV